MKKIYMLEVRQPIGTFYVGRMSADDVIAISKVSRREGRDGHQRQLKEKRAKEIALYCQDPDATFPSVNWDEVSSNVERLPYLARMLEQNTPKIKPKPASDKELFTFAEKDGWKDAIPAEDMEYMRALIADYEEILKRARLLNIERKTMTHRSDIERILYARGQENTFNRKFAFEVLPDMIVKYAKEVPLC